MFKRQVYKKPIALCAHEECGVRKIEKEGKTETKRGNLWLGTMRLFFITFIRWE